MNLWIFEERTKNGNKPTESDAGGTVSGTAGKTGSEENQEPFALHLPLSTYTSVP